MASRFLLGIEERTRAQTREVRFLGYSDRLSRSTYRVVATVAALAAAAILISACGSSSKSSSTSSGASAATSSSSASSNSGASGAPIKVGAVTALTGPIPIPDGTNGAKAYFDSLNAKGGVNGHKIDYIVKDDATNPQLAAQNGHQLVNGDNVVAMAGAESLVDCAVDGKFYQQSGVADVMAGAAIPPCFLSANISPVNVGPAGDLTAALIFASQDLHKKRVCSSMYNIPFLNPVYQPAINAWTQATGKKLAFYTGSQTQNTDLNGLMLQFKNAKCDAVVSEGPSQAAAPFLQAANSQHLTATQIFLGQEYVAGLPKAIGSLGEGIYSEAELLPFTANDPALTQFKADAQKAGIEASGLSEAGWLAAKILADTMSKISGPITRQSVTAALKNLTSYDTNGLTGSPYSFGPGQTHMSNNTIKFVQIKSGQWTVASGWVKIPHIAL